MVVGDVKIIASDRTDTIVTVHPTDKSKKDDIQAAEQTTVDLVAGNLTVKAPRGWRIYTPFGGSASIDVTVEAPAGSQLRGSGSVARFLATGELGQCDIKASVGDIQLDKAGPLDLRTSGGNITVDEVVSRANISTSTGIVRIREIDGSAVIKNSNGDSVIREAAGDLQISAANGNITVERPQGSVNAKTANGNIRIGDATRGTVQLQTSVGEVEIGIHPGTAAWLDVSARHGSVQNLMATVEAPEDTSETVQVYARNAFGNIIIRHATAV
ncbi:MAG TPA: DUF4097 family beta strand repeat-containing protein [Pseudonocardiaceae bacterium]